MVNMIAEVNVHIHSMSSRNLYTNLAKSSTHVSKLDSKKVLTTMLFLSDDASMVIVGTLRLSS